MQHVLALMGPTASGKTSLAIQYSQDNPVDIISVDSAMVYKGLDIGTAKPTADELKKAPHQLINICDPAEIYNASRFVTDAVKAIETSFANQRTPLLVGGSMLYFHALENGLSALPNACAQTRSQITEEANEHGWESLHAQLQEIDPQAATRIHPNDPQRVQRALEVYRLTGNTMTELQKQNTKPLNYPIKYFTPPPIERDELHTRIENRFEQMLDQGFLKEVEQLFQRKDLNLDTPAIRSVGYRQAWKYLQGDDDYPTFKEKAIIATRQLAKRQLTWLRSWPNITIWPKGT